MAEINLNAGTSIAQLQAFQQSVGDKAEIRARKNDDNSITLYTHSKWKISFNRNPELRQAKQQAAFNGVAEFLKAKYPGSAANAESLFGSMNRPLTSATLSNAVIAAAKNANSNIDTVLGDPALRAAFRKHVEKEFSTENLNFYEATEQLEAMVDDPAVNVFHLRKELDRIETEFVAANSAQQVNISNDERRGFHDKAAALRTQLDNQRKSDQVLGRDTQTQPLRQEFKALLQPAKKQVCSLMNSDSLARFWKSPDSDGLLTQAVTQKLNNELGAEKDRLIREALAQNGLV